MEYIAGTIHEKYQIPRALEISDTFVIGICKIRYTDTDLIDDNSIIDLETIGGDIIVVRFFDPNGSSGKGNYSTPAHLYIDKLIRGEVEIKIKAESILSKDFIEINTDPKSISWPTHLHESSDKKWMFRDVTKEYNREEKINQIIK